MKEASALIERARRYLRSSQLLLEDGGCESSVSRAYYAMFYAVEAVLLTKGLSFSSHKGVISAFGEHFIKSGIFPREMGKELNRAFGKRQIGDYEYTFIISRDDAEQMLHGGVEFVNTIAGWLGTND